ncbi:response regulator [Roseimaritima ulvae]|uniref:Response regulator PleD n=1 Tax=Roseimaritima ulvae TaxID=980254 RepID=A0A5B9QSQ7_9BACT|nr:response regulator [Roseimaritima ulvae]QEG42108.1 response regulator PleD [Roseimaritima ulvae]
MEPHFLGPGAKVDRPRPQRSGRVLVVDASPLSLIALAGVLDAEGFVCTCARNPAAALKAAQQETLDLVVCDVGDDAPAALQLITDIRTMETCRDLPAVLIAESQWAGLEKKSQPLGAVHCLFKPLDPSSLLAVVDQAMWMPHLVNTHRRRGSRPTRSGWVNL